MIKKPRTGRNQTVLCLNQDPDVRSISRCVRPLGHEDEHAYIVFQSEEIEHIKGTASAL